MTKLLTLWVALSCALIGVAHSETLLDEKHADPAPLTPPSDQVPSGLIKLGTNEAFSEYAFIMDKSTRTLSVWRNNNGKVELVTVHPADVGRKSGNKMAVGDHRTPEGIYFFRQHLDDQTLNLDGVQSFVTPAFTTDYPNFFDRFERKTGTGIWLHTIPNEISLTRGSRGCIVVRSDVLKSLGSYIHLDETPILITNKVDYARPSELESKRQQLMTWLENWRTSWESKSLDSYMEHYHPSFSALRMSKDLWRKYKESLALKYGFIKVQIREPAIYVHQNTAVIRFFQIYQSDKTADFGEKTLYVKLDGDKPTILGEQWAEVVDQRLVKKFSESPESTASPTESRKVAL